MSNAQRSSLTEYVNKRISRNTNHSLISEIHPEINFKKNSVNLLVGPRGSGKTFNVAREIAKVCQIKDNPYNLFVYVTDKTNDTTMQQFEELITIEKMMVPYEDAEEFIQNLYQCKEAYDEVITKNLENQLTEQSKNEILNGIGANEFSKPWHTLILYDDAQQIFKKKGLLFKLLFQNRQPRVTYFIALQDGTGIDASIKSNLDAYWLFGGFSRQKFLYHFQQITSPMDKEEIWNKYQRLPRNTALLFYYGDSTQLRVIK